MIALMRGRGGMAVVLVALYFEFTKRLADDFIILNRGKIILAGDKAAIRHDDIRTHLTV